MLTSTNSIDNEIIMKTTLQNHFRLTLFVFCVGLLTGSAISQEVSIPKPSEPPMEATLTMNIYSGMPDPECTLSASEVKQVMTAMEKLPPGKAENGQGRERGLAYTGMTLGMRDANNKDLYTYVKVYRDHVQYRLINLATRQRGKSTNVTVYKYDEGKIIETMLLLFLDDKMALPDDALLEALADKDVRKREK